MESVAPKHEHSNPPPQSLKVPRSEWSRVVQRVAQGESLRQVARSYRVSYEAIRRILAAARRNHANREEEPLE
jgi:Mor family transcriptional regulator